MAGPGGEGRRRRSRRRGPFASSEAESATTPHARTQPASGRSGRRTGRTAPGSRCVQLLRGGFSAEARPAPLSRFRGGGGGGCSCPLALPLASPAAGKKLGRALQPRRRWRRAGRAVGAPGRSRRAASDTSPWRPLPRRRRPARPGGGRGPSGGTELRVPGRARAGASAERAPRVRPPDRSAGWELRWPRGATWRPLPPGPAVGRARELRSWAKKVGGGAGRRTAGGGRG